MEKALAAAGADPKAQIEEAMEVYGRIFDANCTHHVIPYKGICKMLDTLKTESVNLAVLSNKPHKPGGLCGGKDFRHRIFSARSGTERRRCRESRIRPPLLEVADRCNW